MQGGGEDARSSHNMPRHRPHDSSAKAPLCKLLRATLATLVVLMLAAIGAASALGAPQYRGAQIHSMWQSVSAAEMTQELNALQSAGVNVARVDVGWAPMEYIEGRKDPTYLGKLDALAAGASARGIKLIAIIAQTPPWASPGGAWNDAPSDPASYGAFVQFITARYNSELAAVEVWNEPEVNENLVAADVPAAYVGLVKAAFAGARAADPNVPVLAGSMSYADIPFLQALYADGMKGYYDGISFHPYADGAAPGDTSVTHSFLGGIEALHAAQQAAGDGTPEWVTEFGWPTGTSRGANTEQQQAEYTEQAFTLLNGVPYVQGATVYELRDMATNPSDPEDNFGMLRQDFTPTPAYAALTRAMHNAAASPEKQESKEPFREGAPETGSGKAEPGSGASSPEGSSSSSSSPSPLATPPQAGTQGAESSIPGAASAGSPGAPASGVSPADLGSGVSPGPHSAAHHGGHSSRRAHVASTTRSHRAGRRVRRFARAARHLARA